MNIERYKGLGDPLTLPAGMKEKPPGGTTGISPKKVLNWSDVQAHLDEGGNWALRVSPNFIVLDVDSHRNADSLKAGRLFVEDKVKTPLVVSSRKKTAPYSGHYWFKLPDSHDPAIFKLESKYKPQGVPCVDIVQAGHRYAIMPGSRHPDGPKYKELGEWSGNIGDIPELPEELYEQLRIRIGEYVPVPEGYQFSIDEIDSKERVVTDQMIRFKLAKEGKRDDTAFTASMAIGELQRMSASRDPVVALETMESQLETMRQYARANKADRATYDKIPKHITKGYVKSPEKIAEVEQDSPIWTRTEVYEKIQRVAIANLFNPYAYLCALLTTLAVSTDHRVRLKIGNHKAAPINLWLVLTGTSGVGKSDTWHTAAERMAELPFEMVDAPEPVTMSPVEGELSLMPGTKSKLRRPFHEDFMAKAGTMNGVAVMFTDDVILKAEGDNGKSVTRRVEAKVYSRMLAYYDECDALLGKSARDYNLPSTLLETFYSKPIRYVVGRKESRISIAGGEYALSVGINVPENAMHRFVNQSKQGFMERCILLDAACPASNDIALGAMVAAKDNDLPIAEWRPVKKADGSYRGLVTFSPKAHREIIQLEAWGRLGFKSHKDIPEKAIERYKKFVPTRQSGHINAKLARLAALLARLHGVEMRKGRVTVPVEYVYDAMEILSESRKSLYTLQQKERDDVKDRRNQEIITHVRKEVGASAARAQSKDKRVKLDAEAMRLQIISDGRLNGVEFNTTAFYRKHYRDLGNLQRAELLATHGFRRRTIGRKAFYDIEKETAA